MAVSDVDYIVGVDEVGRGPLAGPVAGCALSVPVSFKKSFHQGVKDSKQLTALCRERWAKKIKEARKNEALDYAVSFVGHTVIDRRGINFSIQQAIVKSLKKLALNPRRTLVLLDGGLKAPKIFKKQKTIIRGDEKEPIVGLASIVAKVTRDRRMRRLAKKYPGFNFETNKGYGTEFHLKRIKKAGVSPIHRKTFVDHIKNL